MTIKIEVVGESIPEVADRLLAIGSSLRGITAASAPVAVEPAEPVKAKPKAKKSPEKEPVEEPVGNDPAATAADPSPQTTSEEATSSASPATSPSEPALDFDKDVGPVVVEAVTTHGREAVVAILGEFGAERASEVPEGQWAELVEALKAL